MARATVISSNGTIQVEKNQVSPVLLEMDGRPEFEVSIIGPHGQPIAVVKGVKASTKQDAIAAVKAKVIYEAIQEN